jgi:hypothetical protein
VTEGAFSSFLLRSLATLEAEHPTGFAGMLDCLGRREVWLEVEQDRVVLESDGASLTRRARGTRASAYARASEYALVAILRGEITLDEAVLQERILLQGRLDDLVAFYAALQLYFNVAVRCPSFAALLAEYLQELDQDSLAGSRVRFEADVGIAALGSAEAKPGTSM